MHQIKIAVIFINPSEDNPKFLLQRPVAGVELFERLVLTLNRSGAEETIIVYHGLTFEEKIKIESKIIKDNRFNGKLKWYEKNDFLKENVLEKIRSEVGPYGTLFISGNIVTTSRHVKDFIRNVLDSKVLDKKVVASMYCGQNGNSGIFLVPTSRLNLINQYIQTQAIEGPLDTIQPAGKHNFCIAVHNISTTRMAEKG